MNKIEDDKKHKLLERWVNEYADSLFSWAYHKTLSKETAEDIVQETFLAATRSFEKCKNPDQPKSWLFAILNNKIIDHFRKKARSFHQVQTPQEKGGAQFIDNFFDQNEHWSKDCLLYTSPSPRDRG